MQTDLNQHIGGNVAFLRAQKQISQVELAERLGAELGRKMDPTAVTRIEKGGRVVSATELVALSAVLQVRLEALLEDPSPVRRIIRAWEQRSQNGEADARRAQSELAHALEVKARAQPMLEAWNALSQEAEKDEPDLERAGDALTVVLLQGNFARSLDEQGDYRRSWRSDPEVYADVVREVLQSLLGPETTDSLWRTVIEKHGTVRSLVELALATWPDQ